MENAGRDCWNGCKKQQGKCEWCGFDGYCCRKNFAPGNGCDGSFGGQNRHVCVLKDEGTYDNCLLLRPFTFDLRHNRCIKSLISELRNLTIVEYKDQTPEVHDSQMWKKEGNHLISKYDGNMLGVHETRGLVTLSEDDEMITPILIDENTTSSFELSLSCM